MSSTASRFERKKRVNSRILLTSLVILLVVSVGLVGCGGEQERERSLIISSTEGGSVTDPGEGTFTYDEGEVVNLVADADEGYQFINWTGDVDGIADSEDATTTITMNGNCTITANFETILPGKYRLTISSTTGGNVTTPGVGTYTYDADTVINLVATPSSGCRFVSWTGNVGTVDNATSATTTIIMHGNYSVTANFEVIRYSLTISSSSGGSVTTPGEGTFTYNASIVVNLVANPLGGYYFVKWTGDVSSVADVNTASTTITMNGSYSIMANFSEIPVHYPSP